MTLFKTYLSDEIFCSIVPRSLILYFSSEQGYSYLCCTIVIKTEIHYWPFFVPASLQAVCMCQCCCSDSIEKHCSRNSLCPGEPTLPICFKKFRPIFFLILCFQLVFWHDMRKSTCVTEREPWSNLFHIEGTIFFFTSAECLESSLACVTIDLLSTIWHDDGRYNWEESSVNALLQPANTC